MENASKALIIAGSVLLAVLIITALIYTFSQISSLKQVEASSEEEKILAQYDKEIESFNRQGLYGSEILSLANLVEDYNKRQSDLKGYKPITLKVSITQIIDAKYLKETEYSKYGDLIKDFKNLEKKMQDLKKEKICGQTLDKLAGMKTEALEDLISRYNLANRTNYTLEEIEKRINDYQSVNSEMQTFKNKKFNTPEVEYDNSIGRIVKMSFREINT